MVVAYQPMPSYPHKASSNRSQAFGTMALAHADRSKLLPYHPSPAPISRTSIWNCQPEEITTTSRAFGAAFCPAATAAIRKHIQLKQLLIIYRPLPFHRHSWNKLQLCIAACQWCPPSHRTVG